MPLSDALLQGLSSPLKEALRVLIGSLEALLSKQIAKEGGEKRAFIVC